MASRDEAGSERRLLCRARLNMAVSLAPARCSTRLIAHPQQRLPVLLGGRDSRSRGNGEYRDGDPRRSALTVAGSVPVRAQEKYGELFRRLERFFEWRRCESPEDLAQETILRVLNKVARGELIINTGDITPLFYGFAKNLLLESRRAAARNRTEELTELLAPGTEGAGPTESRILVAQCLKVLSPRERRLLIAYYAGDRSELRRDLNLSDGAL